MKEKVVIGLRKYEIDGIRFFGHQLEIEFDSKVNVERVVATVGRGTVDILTRGGQLAGHYTGFKTVYRRDGQILTLSDDGSTWTEGE